MSFAHDELPAPHRTFVRFVNNRDDSGAFVEYFCEDPTCEWHVTELGCDCNDFREVLDSGDFTDYNPTRSRGAGFSPSRKDSGSSDQLNFSEI